MKLDIFLIIKSYFFKLYKAVQVMTVLDWISSVKIVLENWYISKIWYIIVHIRICAKDQPKSWTGGKFVVNHAEYLNNWCKKYLLLCNNLLKVFSNRLLLKRKSYHIFVSYAGVAICCTINIHLYIGHRDLFSPQIEWNTMGVLEK